MQAPIKVNASAWLTNEQGVNIRRIALWNGIALKDLPFDAGFDLSSRLLGAGPYGITVKAFESVTGRAVLDAAFPNIFEVLPFVPEPPAPEFKFFLGQEVCTTRRVGNITELPLRVGGSYRVLWFSPPEVAGQTSNVPESGLMECDGEVPQPPPGKEPEPIPEAPRQQFSIGDLVFVGGASATTWVITDTRLSNGRWEYFIDVERGVGGNPGWVRENSLSLAIPPPEEPEPPPEEPGEEPLPPPLVGAPDPKFSEGELVFVGGSRATIWVITDREFRDGRWRYYVDVSSGSGNAGWVGESLLSPA